MDTRLKMFVCCSALGILPEQNLFLQQNLRDFWCRILLKTFTITRKTVEYAGHLNTSPYFSEIPLSNDITLRHESLNVCHVKFDPLDRSIR